MGIKEDYQQAQQLAKSGKYEQARRLLIVHDHPKTNTLLAKINEVMASTGDAPKVKRGFSFLNVIVGVVNAIVSAVIVIWCWSLLDNAIYDMRENYIMTGVLFVMWLALVVLIDQVWKRIRV